jgi:hypothetical protein
MYCGGHRLMLSKEQWRHYQDGGRNLQRVPMAED